MALLVLVVREMMDSVRGRVACMALVVVIAVLTVGCVDNRLVDCGGYSCPEGYRCLAVGGCASPEEDSACPASAPDGQPCGSGFCRDGACIEPRCGNRIVEVEIGEICDDGNDVVGDGCSAGCRSDETCGNGVADTVATGEECDCGTDAGGVLPAYCRGQINSDVSGEATCRSDCRFARCGDGVIDHQDQCEGSVAAATCQSLGYYRGAHPGCGQCQIEAECTDCCDPADEVDGKCCSGRCGDGVVDATYEFCDGPVQTGCTSFGFDFGRPTCTSICSANFDSCDSIGWRDAASISGGWVAGTSSSDVYVTNGYNLYHFDGASWTQETASVGLGGLTAISGSSPDQMWFAGPTWVVHRTPAGWSSYDLQSLVPNHPSGSSRALQLTDIAAVASDRIYVVGRAIHQEQSDECVVGGPCPPPPADIKEAVIFEGTSVDGVNFTWQLQQTVGLSFIDVELSAVWASPTSQLVVAVGGNLVATTAGSGWQITFNTTNTTARYDDVWGSSDSDIYIVGDEDAQPVALHYSGTGTIDTLASWSSNWSSSANRPQSIWGSSASDVLALAKGGGATAIYHFDGRRWTPTLAPPEASQIWGAPGVVYTTGTTLRRAEMLWDDLSGSFIVDSIADAQPSFWAALYDTSTNTSSIQRGGAVVPFDVAPPAYYEAKVAAQGATTAFAMVTKNSIEDASIYRFDGAQMAKICDLSNILYAIDASPTYVAAVGMKMIVEPSASDCAVIDTVATFAYTGALLDVWVGGSDAVAVGDSPPALFVRTGGSWSQMPMPAPIDHFTPSYVIGTSATDFTLVGRNLGTFATARYSGTTWTVSPMPDVTRLWAVGGSSSSSLFASVTTTFGLDKKLIAYDGLGWTDITAPIAQKIWISTESTPEGLYVGSAGLFYRLFRPLTSF